MALLAYGTFQTSSRSYDNLLAFFEHLCLVLLMCLALYNKGRKQGKAKQTVLENNAGAAMNETSTRPIGSRHHTSYKTTSFTLDSSILHLITGQFLWIRTVHFSNTFI